jgi:hypothetical protein
MNFYVILFDLHVYERYHLKRPELRCTIFVQRGATGHNECIGWADKTRAWVSLILPLYYMLHNSITYLYSSKHFSGGYWQIGALLLQSCV